MFFFLLFNFNDLFNSKPMQHLFSLFVSMLLTYKSLELYISQLRLIEESSYEFNKDLNIIMKDILKLYSRYE